ncbi:unnamed protein product, partial [Toxocara canis]|uniref:Fucosyltransferase n=1 Tax=Toxocara canis TaxID=6265 RepID=A0A183VD43_TOXCA
MQAPPTNDSAYHSRINVSTSWVLSNRNTTDMDSGMSSESRKCFHFSSVKYGDLCVESILGDEQFRLADKLHSHATMSSRLLEPISMHWLINPLGAEKHNKVWKDRSDPQCDASILLIRVSEAPKMILSFVRHITQSNLGGCPDWNCKILNTKALSREKVDAFVTGPMPIYKIRLSPQQYVVCHSQEANFCTIFLSQNRANMTMTYRRNSPISSPYGYTVKLAPVSQRNDGKQPINEKRIRKKSKAIAWFVSNCFAASGREEVISELKKYIDVDIYGRCGKMYCTKGGQCEQMLNTDYHFYAAFENSISDDYITEKLWHQGYQFDVIPLVLKRRIVERYVPPYSFIAVDSFDTPREMAQYLNYLMQNKSAYLEYFAWRKNYAVIYLDGTHHDRLERPWGVCQLCRFAPNDSLFHRRFVSR